MCSFDVRKEMVQLRGKCDKDAFLEMFCCPSCLKLRKDKDMHVGFGREM